MAPKPWEGNAGAGHAGPFKGTDVTGQPIDAELLDDGGDVAAVVTVGGVPAPGESELSRSAMIRATWILAKRDGERLVTAHHNSGVYEA